MEIGFRLFVPQKIQGGFVGVISLSQVEDTAFHGLVFVE